MKTLGLWILAFIALALIPSASPARAADAPTALDIFAKHAAAVGYSLGDARAKPFVAESSQAWVDFKGGHHASLSVRTQAGPYFREDLTYAGSTSYSGFDGTNFWNCSANGNTTGDTGYSRPFDVAWAVVDSEGFDASLAPEMRNLTSTAYVVRIHPLGGMTTDVYFDRNTWLIDQVIVDPEGDAVRQEYADYKPYGPVKVATIRRINRLTITLTKFTWNAPVDQAGMSAPRNVAYAVFPSGGTVVVPFDPHGGVVVEGTINGVSGHFAIDPYITGFTVDPLMAEKAGLVKSTDARFDFNNPEDLLATPQATVRVGGLILRDVHIAVFSNNFAETDTPYDGYLGLDLFAKAVTSINFDARTVTFTDPAIFAPPTNVFALPLALDGGSAETVATVNGSENLHLQLSFGFQARLGLWQTYMQRHPDVAHSIGALVTLSGPSPGQTGIIKSLKIGPYEQDSVSVTPLGFPDGESFDTGGEGILGEGVLSAFNLTVDYPDLEIFLSPTKRSL